MPPVILVEQSITEGLFCSTGWTKLIVLYYTINLVQ